MDDMWGPQRTIIDLTDYGVARLLQICGLCGSADELFRLVTSPSAFCDACFRDVYARA